MQESREIKAEENLRWLVKLKEVILAKAADLNSSAARRSGESDSRPCFIGLLSSRREPRGTASCMTNI